MKHLVIRAPNWVGDLVMATPILEAAVEDPRFERVTVAVRPHLASILGGGPCADRLLLIEGRDQEAAQLRAAGADGILLLSNSLGSAWARQARRSRSWGTVPSAPAARSCAASWSRPTGSVGR